MSSHTKIDTRRFYLGINSVYHESSAAIVIDGKLVAAAEEERFNRNKHGKKASIANTVLLPFKAIDWCLHECNITIDDIYAIGYSFDPATRWEMNVNAQPDYPLTEGSYGTKLGEDRFKEMNNIVQSILEGWYNTKLDGKFNFISHHLSHLASAYYPSPYNDAALICVDGIGEWATSTIAQGKNGKIKILDEIEWPHSIGFLWEKFTGFLGFKRNNDECKVMGLASYGDPSIYRKQFDSFIEWEDGIKFKIDDNIVRFRQEEDYSRIESIFGPRRHRYDTLCFEGEDTRHADIAATLQEVTNKAILNLAEHAFRLTSSKYLCLAGGVALNCVTNGHVVKNGPFEDIWIQPAANDAGTAAGAALHLCSTKSDLSPHSDLATHKGFSPHSGLATHIGLSPHSDISTDANATTDKDTSTDANATTDSDTSTDANATTDSDTLPISEITVQRNFTPYLGPSYSPSQYRATLQTYDLEEAIIDYKESSIEDAVAEKLADGSIIGWFQGALEWGPRALGNRSILASPVGNETKDIINQRVKHRECFRPFCPSVLDEHAGEWFDFFGKPPVSAAEYMLIAYEVKEDKAKQIPAVVHVDQTARVQLVKKEAAPRYHKLISAFNERTGIPLLLNTSFNDCEPIVCTPADAIECFLRTEIDYLVLGDLLIARDFCSRRRLFSKRGV